VIEGKNKALENDFLIFVSTLKNEKQKQ